MECSKGIHAVDFKLITLALFFFVANLRKKILKFMPLFELHFFRLE